MARPKVYTDQTQPYSLTIRIPRDLFDQMERYTGRHGRSRTEAIVEGLKLWLERQASSIQLSHNNNNAVMHELMTPAHFLDGGIPFDDDYVPVPAPATPAVADIVHDNNNAVMQEAVTKRRRAKVQPTVLQAAQNPALAEDAPGHSADVPAYDTTRFYLGKLCPKGHDYEGTGQSLLRKHNQSCRACENERKKARRQAQRQGTAAD